MASIAIGDIHGNLAALNDLLAQVEPTLTSQDTVVFLGDYIDRGTRSAQVLDRIINLRHDSEATVVALEGNHGDWLLKTMDDYTKHSWLLATEAYSTIRSYSAGAAEALHAAELTMDRGAFALDTHAPCYSACTNASGVFPDSRQEVPMSRTLLAVAVAVAVVSAAALLSLPTRVLAQSIVPQPTTISGATSHLYKSVNGADLRLHVFTPSNPSKVARRAAIVFFFGGGWTNGSVEQFVPQARHLAQRGMVAIVSDYRVRARHQTTPFDAMDDAQSAIVWVRAHATQLGIDPNRIAASGGSSGGHIALSAAVFGKSETNRTGARPNALVLFNPAVDTSSLTGEGRFGARAEEASPLHHVRTDLPATLILHGKADTTVAYATVERFCAASVKLKNQCQLIGYEGATHGFFNPSREGGRWYRETLLETVRFLTALGYIPGPSPERIDE